MPLISEVSAIWKELMKNRTFDWVILPQKAYERSRYGTSDVKYVLNLINFMGILP
jgi:hypothetical protein